MLHWNLKSLDHCVTPQAAKSLIYFFAKDKSAIYTTAIFAIFSHNTQSLRSQMTKLVGQGRSGWSKKQSGIVNAFHAFNQLGMSPKVGGIWSMPKR